MVAIIWAVSRPLSCLASVLLLMTCSFVYSRRAPLRAGTLTHVMKRAKTTRWANPFR